jgi:hypothetical protein
MSSPKLDFLRATLARRQPMPPADGATVQWTDVLLPRHPLIIDPPFLTEATHAAGQRCELRPLLRPRCGRRRDPDPQRNRRADGHHLADPARTIQRLPQHLADTADTIVKATAARSTERGRALVLHRDRVREQVPDHHITR